MRRLLIAALLVAGCAAESTRPSCPPAGPRLALTADGEPVDLLSAACDVRIEHGLAATTLDLVFKNDRDRVLEGELLVPLPEGASLCSFALDVDGAMREATVVERERARVAFESVERRKVDPGLVEWSHGNVFRTRVYPIPARGVRRVRLGFEQEVSERFQLDLGVRARGTLTLDGEARTVEGPIDVALPPLHAPDGVVDPDRAFFARVPLGEPRCAPLPARVTVLWDASLARSRDTKKERAVLTRVLDGVKTIRLVTFAHEVLGDEVLASPTQVDERLARTEQDGGTFFGCLDVASLESATDAFLLVSDGVATLGGALPATRKPLTALVSGEADFTALAKIGRVVNLRGLSVEEAARRVLSEPRELVGVVGAASVLPAPGARIEGSVLTLAGRIEGFGDTIHVLVQDGAGVRSTPVPLRLGEGASRAFARRQVAALLAAPRVDVAAVVSLAKAERIATPFTSFIVLETLADYERFGVEPPPELDGVTNVIAQAYFMAGKALFDDLQYREADAFFRVALLAAPTDRRAERMAEKTFWLLGDRLAPDTSEASLRDERTVSGREVENTYIPANRVVSVPETSTRRREIAEGQVAELEQLRAGIRAKTSFTEHSDEEVTGFPAPELGLPSTRATQGYPGPRIQISRPSTGNFSFDDDHGSFEKVAPGPKLPDAIALLASAATPDLDALYFEHRTKSPAFYAAAADLYFSRGLRSRGLRVLTSLAALDAGDPCLLRILAKRLEEAAASRLAVPVLERVASLRPEEPQSFRDLALAQADVGQITSAAENLAHVITHPWDSRFEGIERIAARELRHLVSPTLDTADLRVVLTWDANDCDVDLWVTEPSGEKVLYSHPISASGGHLSRDFTQGYGPEEFVLEHAPPGDYVIQANFFGDGRQTRATDATILVTIVTDWGRPTEKRARVVHRLTERQEVVTLGRVTMGR